MTLWKKRKFKKEALDAECYYWLQLLLNRIDITKDHPEFLLKKFLSQRDVCKKHKETIIKTVM